MFLLASIISYIAQCAYDDLPNTWSCHQVWATPLMYDFDVAIFLISYPAIFIGILIALFRLIFRDNQSRRASKW